MIYKLVLEDSHHFAQAKSQLHLLQSYDQEYTDFQHIKEVIEISEEEAKTIMLSNTDYDENAPEDMKEISLYDTVVGDDFVIVGSTDWE